MSRQRWIIAGVFVAVLALGGPLLAIATDPSKPEQKTPPLDLASASASKFLNTYVDPSGRVKVSEGVTQGQGQAWALLIAAGSGDNGRFKTILGWTNTNVATSQETTEIAADIAWSLAAAGQRLGDANYTSQANARAADIFTATPGNPSGGVDNSIFFKGLNQLKGSVSQVQLRALADNQRQGIQRSMTDREKDPDNYAFLPTDKVGGNYTGSALNIPLNLSTSCDPSDAKAATFVWTKLRVSRDTRTATALTPDGKVVDKSLSVRAAVASAASAQAAGEQLQAYELLDDADGIRDKHDTMEASAWDALGRILVTTPWLGNCS